VDTPTPFHIDLQLMVTDVDAFQSIASFSFFEDGIGTDFERQLPGSEEQTLVGDLVPGSVYSIVALARSTSLLPNELAMSSVGASSFDFTLAVPEASTASLMVLGLLMLAWVGRRR